MIRFSCPYIGLLVTLIVRVSKDEITASKATVKAVGSGTGLAIFSIMNRTINSNERNFRNKQVHYFDTGSTENNTIKDQKKKRQGFGKQRTKNNRKQAKLKVEYYYAMLF